MVCGNACSSEMLFSAISGTKSYMQKQALYCKKIQYEMKLFIFFVCVFPKWSYVKLLFEWPYDRYLQKESNNCSRWLFHKSTFFRHLWLLYKCSLDHKWYSVCAITLHSYDWLGTVFFNCAVFLSYSPEVHLQILLLIKFSTCLLKE